MVNFPLEAITHCSALCCLSFNAILMVSNIEKQKQRGSGSCLIRTWWLWDGEKEKRMCFSTFVCSCGAVQVAQKEWSGYVAAPWDIRIWSRSADLQQWSWMSASWKHYWRLMLKNCSQKSTDIISWTNRKVETFLRRIHEQNTGAKLMIIFHTKGLTTKLFHDQKCCE